MTLACANVESGIGSMAKLGYRVEFKDLALPSDPAKIPLLSMPRDMHAIVFERADQGLPIELVHYAPSLPEPRGRFIGVFGCVPSPLNGDDAPSARIVETAAVAFDRSIKYGQLAEFNAPALFSTATGKPSGLFAAVLPVSDIERSSKFWRLGLGFREVARGEGWLRLGFASPVAAWCFDVVLVKDEDRGPNPCLDGRGMTCLSFVCSSVERSLPGLASNGAQHSRSVFDAHVNGRKLKVAMLGGPDGEFVELLQVVN